MHVCRRTILLWLVVSEWLFVLYKGNWFFFHNTIFSNYFPPNCFFDFPLSFAFYFLFLLIFHYIILLVNDSFTCLSLCCNVYFSCTISVCLCLSHMSLFCLFPFAFILTFPRLIISCGSSCWDSDWSDRWWAPVPQLVRPWLPADSSCRGCASWQYH